MSRDALPATPWEVAPERGIVGSRPAQETPLPSPETVDLRAALEEVRAEVERDVPADAGELARYIPALARAERGRFALAACGVDGRVEAAGDAGERFTLQSLAKPFLYGLALDRFGAARVHERVGVEPTGGPFDGIVRLDEANHRPHNAMVNAGAIAVAGMLARAGGGRGTARLLADLGAFAGRATLEADAAVLRSERGADHKNRAIAHLLRHFGALEAPVDETLELYVHACSARVDARELARMAAVLANGGACPATGARLLAPETVGTVLAVLATCGLYDGAGRFLFDVGLPGKSGVSGGLLAVAPGRLGLAAWAPPLDGAGNSVRGVAALARLSRRLGLHAFEPRRAARPRGPSLDAAALERARRAGLAARGGRVAAYAPTLAGADPERLALAACTVEGLELACGDADAAFTLQAAANPFGYAYACRAVGAAAVATRTGVEPSGNPFHAIRFDPRTGRPSNPLGNAGAIAVADLAPGADPAARLEGLRAFLGELAGLGPPEVDEATLAGERAAGERNRAIASLLRGAGLVADEVAACELYLRQCSVRADVARLARMGATLANGGTCPSTGRRVLAPDVVRDTLVLMHTCGHHDASGRVAVRLGLPSKSGISGAIVAVVPGRAGLAVWSPAVDEQGTSVRGLAALEALSRELGLAVFGPAA